MNNILYNSNSMKKQNGVLYIATGQKYLNEAITSAKSVRESNKNLSIALATDISVIEADIFDDILHVSSSGNGYLDKIIHMASTPFERTIFLDTDTYVNGSLLPLFTILERFDLAICHAPYREIYQLEHVPITFPELNTGMLAYRSCEGVLNLFKSWREVHEKEYLSKEIHDQPALREVLYQSNIRFAVTIDEYNCRFRMGYANKKVVVMHDRHPNLDAVSRQINEHEESKRIFRKTKSGVEVFYATEKEYYQGRIWRKVKELIKAIITIP